MISSEQPKFHPEGGTDLKATREEDTELLPGREQSHRESTRATIVTPLRCQELAAKGTQDVKVGCVTPDKVDLGI
jgi:hypothetical protein